MLCFLSWEKHCRKQPNLMIKVKTEDASKLTSSRNDEIEIKDQQIARIQHESEDLKQQLLDKTQFAAKVNEQLKSLEKGEFIFRLTRRIYL